VIIRYLKAVEIPLVIFSNAASNMGSALAFLPIATAMVCKVRLAPCPICIIAQPRKVFQQPVNQKEGAFWKINDQNAKKQRGWPNKYELNRKSLLFLCGFDVSSA
jgi:hypothetical protein